METIANDAEYYLVDTVNNTILARASIGNPLKTLQGIKDGFLETQKRNLGVSFPARYEIRRSGENGYL